MGHDTDTCSGWRFAKRTDWNLEGNQFSERMAALKVGGTPLLDLSISNPLRCGFDLSALDLAHSFDRKGLCDYQPDPLGLPSAREAVCRYYAGRGVTVEPSRLLLTPSTSDAYNYIFRLLCEAGDEVLVPAPSYPLFSYLADIADIRLCPYRLKRSPDGLWSIDADSMLASIGPRCRAIMLVNPNNPTGSFIRREDLNLLTRIATERRLALICDEVFGDYVLDAAPDAVVSLAGHAVDALTFVLSGISKILALPQMKLGWMLVQGPKGVAEDAMRRLEMIADSFLSVGTPVMLAMPEWMNSRELIQGQILDRARRNLESASLVLRDKPGLKLLRVEGGWYAVLRMEGILNEESFLLRLMEEERVAAHPGYFYDFAEGSHAVLSLLCPEAEWTEGLRRLASLHERVSY